MPFWYQLLLVAALGLIWGSFVVALSSRWPRGERIAVGRSHCDNCKTTLTTQDLIPLFSYLLLRGRCRYCAHRIGASAFYIELVSAAIGLAAMLVLSEGQAVSAAAFGWLLLPLAVLDFQKLWLPNQLILALALGGAVMGHVLTPEITGLDRIFAGVIGFLSLEAIRQIFRHLRKVEGMGGGDPKLFGAIGIWLGWQSLPMTLLLSCLVGFAFILASYARSKQSPVHQPLGSFLCIGAFFMAMLL